MTTREKLIEARKQRANGELAKARELELYAMDELLQREYAEIDSPVFTEIVACLKKYQARYHAAGHAQKDWERSDAALKRWEKLNEGK